MECNGKYTLSRALRLYPMMLPPGDMRLGAIVFPPSTYLLIPNLARLGPLQY